MFCPNCGKEIPDGPKFCSYCNYQIAKVDKEQKVQTIELTNKRVKKQLLFAVLTIIIGILFVVAGGWFISAGRLRIRGKVGRSFLILVGIVWFIIDRIKIGRSHNK